MAHRYIETSLEEFKVMPSSRKDWDDMGQKPQDLDPSMQELVEDNIINLVWRANKLVECYCNCHNRLSSQAFCEHCHPEIKEHHHKPSVADAPGLNSDDPTSVASVTDEERVSAILITARNKEASAGAKLWWIKGILGVWPTEAVQSSAEHPTLAKATPVFFRKDAVSVLDAIDKVTEVKGVELEAILLRYQNKTRPMYRKLPLSDLDFAANTRLETEGTNQAVKELQTLTTKAVIAELQALNNDGSGERTLRYVQDRIAQLSKGVK